MKPAPHMPSGRALASLGLPQPVMTFRINPENRRKHYFTVEVYQTWQQLAKVHRLWWPKGRDHNVWGFVQRTRSSADPRAIGVICFYLRSCTDSTVSHEMFHAALAWADSLKMDPCDVCGWRESTHERVAEAHGYMVSRFWQKFTQAGYQRVECWGFSKRRQQCNE